MSDSEKTVEVYTLKGIMHDGRLIGAGQALRLPERVALGLLDDGAVDLCSGPEEAGELGDDSPETGILDDDGGPETGESGDEADVPVAEQPKPAAKAGKK